LPGYTASAWYGLLAPKGLPADIRTKLESAARTALQRPDLLARVKEDGAAASGMGGAEFAAFMAAERKRWGEVIRDADLKPLDN
jgi:tripartite-type tricarboxylate transporter receptor subunit TctC